MNPLLLPLWLAGLFAAFLGMQAKNYYLAPVYPVLLAAGAVVVGGTGQRTRPRLALGAVAFLLLAFVPLAPYVLPILPVPSIPAYMAMLGIREVRAETREMADVPQIFADMLGWDDLVAEIARVHAALPPEERRHAIVWGGNYGVAGAVDHLGRRYDLPRAISGHQNYWLWRTPGQKEEPIIAAGIDERVLRQWFAEVETAGEVRCEYCMPDRRLTRIFVCRAPRVPMDELWPLTKCWTCDRPAFATTTPDSMKERR